MPFATPFWKAVAAVLISPLVWPVPATIVEPVVKVLKITSYSLVELRIWRIPFLMGLMLASTLVGVSVSTKLKTYLTVFLHVQPSRAVPLAQVRHWKGDPMHVVQGKAQAMHSPSRKPDLRVKPALHSVHTLGALHSVQFPVQVTQNPVALRKSPLLHMAQLLGSM